MDVARILDELQAAGPRRACSDAERRTARLLGRSLGGLGRRPRTETAWVRPQWPAIWLAHALLGVAASVGSVAAPRVALGVLVGAALSAVVELSGRAAALSLLWPARATQNVVSDGPGRAPVRLLVTAAYDTPPARPSLSAPLQDAEAWLRRLTRGRWPSGLALLSLALAALAGCAAVRVAGVHGIWIGAVQLAPSIVCIAAVPVLVDLALAAPAAAGGAAATGPQAGAAGATGPQAGAHPWSTAPAALLALVAQLDRRPPRRLEVDVLLAGAGAAGALGMRAFVRRRRRAVRAEEVAVLHLEPCGSGSLRVWRSDGPLLAAAMHPQLVEAAERADFVPHRGRGTTGALVARRAGWPAVAVGRLDTRGRVPERVSAEDVADTAARCADLVRRLDAQLAGHAFDQRPGTG